MLLPINLPASPILLPVNLPLLRPGQLPTIRSAICMNLLVNPLLPILCTCRLSCRQASALDPLRNTVLLVLLPRPNLAPEILLGRVVLVRGNRLAQVVLLVIHLL